MRHAIALIILLLAGCASRPPKVETVYVTVEKMVEVPEELSRDCYDEPAKEQTYAEAKRLANLRKEALAECTKRMQRIRDVGRP